MGGGWVGVGGVRPRIFVGGFVLLISLRTICFANFVKGKAKKIWTTRITSDEAHQNWAFSSSWKRHILHKKMDISRWAIAECQSCLVPLNKSLDAALRKVSATFGNKLRQRKHFQESEDKLLDLSSLTKWNQKRRRRVVYSFDINTNRKWFEHLKHRSKNYLKQSIGSQDGGHIL